MKIRISCFRQYDDNTFTFADHKITNLSGASGAGKSTIFSAFYWALFGVLKNTQPHGKKGKKTFVEIEYGKLKIYRQSRPCLLKVRYQDKDYEDDQAQAIIHSLFGEKSVWLCTSYLPQNERNILLAGSTNDKMDLLNKLTFGNVDDIDNALDLIEQHIFSITSEIKVLSDNVSELQKISFSGYENYVPEIDRKATYDVYQSLKNILTEAEEKMNSQKIIQGKFLSLSEQKDTLNEKLQGVISELKDKKSLETLKKELSDAEFICSKAGMIKEIKSIKQKISLISTDKIFSQQDLISAKMTSEKRNENLRIATGLNLEYSEEKISSWITENEKLLSENIQRKKSSEYRKLKAQLPEEKNYSEIISEIKEKIRMHEESLITQKCPLCQGNLKIVNGKITAGSEITTQNININELKISLIKLQNTEKIYSKIKNDIDNLGEVNLDLPEPINEVELTKNLAKAKGIKFFPEINITEIQNSLEKISLQKRLVELQNLCPEDLEIPEVLPDIKEIKNNLGIREKLDNTHENLTSQLIAVEEKLKEIPEIDFGLQDYIDACLSEMKKAEQLFADWEKADQEITLRNKIEADKNRITVLTKKLQRTRDLKNITMTLECKMLQTTVDKVNRGLNSMISKIFDEPLSIRLNVFKTPKSSGRVKPGVNVCILYKGGEYESINDMSGGEGDRISLALTIALNQISGSPIMLLDETMTSLNADLREKCLETLKENTNKTVLCIDHESIEGYYDHVVNI